MGQQSNIDTFHVLISGKVVTLLKQGIVPWRRTITPYWGLARNYVTDKVYTGINWFILHLLNQYDSPYFLTHNQIIALDGWLHANAQAEYVWCYEINSIQEVFNSKYILGIEFTPPTFPLDIGGSDWGGDMILDILIEKWGTELFVPHEQNVSSYYLGEALPYPYWDWSCMYNPALSQELFPKLIHWTGHQNRLGRPAIIQQIDKRAVDFKEELLIAKIGTAYLCLEAGINREEYIQSTKSYKEKWINYLQADSELVLRAATKAYNAIEYLFSGREKYRDHTI